MYIRHGYLFPRELSDITGIAYFKIKIAFDVICLAVTALLTGLLLGRIDGLGIGTVVAVFIMGEVFLEYSKQMLSILDEGISSMHRSAKGGGLIRLGFLRVL